jgi:hypothetical protein
MTAAEQEEVRQCLEELEDRFGFRVPDGPHNPDLQFMCHLWEPLRVMHKPFLLHLGSEASTLLSHAVLSLMGFTKYHTGTLSYWAKNLSPPDKTGATVSVKLICTAFPLPDS